MSFYAPSNLKNNTGIPIQFDWKAHPLTWAGYTQEELVGLVGRIAGFFMIPQEIRPAIQIYFGDHDTFIGKDGKPKAFFATATPRSDKGQKSTTGYDIRLNRSLEGFLECIGRDSNYMTDSKKGDYIIRDLEIRATLQNSWEGLVWLVGEELHHAGFELGMDPEEFETKLVKYLVEAARLFNMPEDIIYYKDHALPYSLNLMEVEASRDVLRLLEELALEKSPDRAPFFRETYELSHEKRMVVTPNHGLIYDDMFVSTGYESR